MSITHVIMTDAQRFLLKYLSMRSAIKKLDRLHLIATALSLAYALPMVLSLRLNLASKAHHSIQDDIPPVYHVHAKVPAVCVSRLLAAPVGPVMRVVPGQTHVIDGQQADVVTCWPALLQSVHDVLPEPVLAYRCLLASLPHRHSLQRLHIPHRNSSH